MANVFRTYSALLLNFLRADYPLSLTVACSIPKRINFFLPKRITLPSGLKIVINNPATLRANIRDAYEIQEYQRCKDFIPSYGDVVFDIGSYVGMFTLRSAKKVGSIGRVYAFEPNPFAFPYLKYNIELNGIENARCFNTAMGSQIGTVTFHVTSDMHIEGSSLFDFHLKRWAKNYSTIEAKMNTVDNVMRQLGIDDVDIVKIDVEGAEEMVLRGAKNALSNSAIDKLIIEAHENVVPLKQTIEHLTSYGYTIHYVFPYNAGLKSIIYAKRAK